jgi:hypothetical protein
LGGEIVKADVSLDLFVMGMVLFYCNVVRFLSSNARFDQVDSALIVTGNPSCHSASGGGFDSACHVLRKPSRPEGFPSHI